MNSILSSRATKISAIAFITGCVVAFVIYLGRRVSQVTPPPSNSSNLISEEPFKANDWDEIWSDWVENCDEKPTAFFITCIKTHYFNKIRENQDDLKKLRDRLRLIKNAEFDNQQFLDIIRNLFDPIPVAIKISVQERLTPSE